MKALPWILLSALVLVWAASRSMADPPADVASAMARVEGLEAALPVITAQRDSARAENVVLAAALDSAHAETARVQTAAVASVTAARARASEVATDLTARLDSTEAALFMSYQEERDSIDEATARAASVLTAELSTAYFRIAGLEAELADERTLSGQLRTALDAAHVALDASNERLRSQDRQNAVLKIGGSLALGKIGYDVLTGES